MTGLRNARALLAGAIPVLSLVLALVLSGSASAAPALEDYLGKWDLVLADSGTSFRACSLLLRAEGGTPRAEIVWRWGSVQRRFERIEVGEDGVLRIAPRKGRKEGLELRLVGGALEGHSTEGDGTRFTVFGTRAIHRVDAAGTWDLTVQAPDGGTATGRLVIGDLGAGRIGARGYDGKGEPVTIERASLAGGRLAVVFGEDRTLELRAEIQGDRLTGSIELDTGSARVTGSRRRRFGPPVELLARDGTAGWHPRDESRPFRWTCRDGVLTNGPHDVDIVSDATFDDFRLELEYRVEEEGANSGIYLRGRYEVQILGTSVLNDHSNGAVYSRLAPRVNPFSGVGKWQRVEITLIDRYVTVKMNGEVVLDNAHLDGITGGALDSREDEPGPLMLQGDHGKIFFRRIRLFPALPAVSPST